MSKSRPFTEEYANINGIKQYFLHYPASSGEVMLNIHGGPGQSEAPFAYYIESQNTSLTSVYYDQRGTGKTLRKNPTTEKDVTLQKLVEDLAETVQYIKQKYQKNKIIISGHSWGSILGLLYTYQYPEDVLYYVGAGQIVNFKKGEKAVFNQLKKSAQNNAKDIRKLEDLGNYPDNIVSVKTFSKTAKTLMGIKNKYGVGMDMKKIKSISMKSPVFSFADVIAMLKAQKLTNHLWEAVFEFNAEEITNFQVPMYFIHGINDGQAPITQVQEYCHKISAPDKYLFPISDAGHICPIDNLEETLLSGSKAMERYMNWNNVR